MNDRSNECMFARKQQTLLMHRVTADISFSLSTQTQRAVECVFSFSLVFVYSYLKLDM